MQYWLFKTEPGCFSWQDLENSPDRTTSWDGVRNYQARNFMRAMRVGERAFFYHSGKHPAIVGIVEVARPAYADHTAQDPENRHFDPKASPEKPIWEMVDVRALCALPKPLSRRELAACPQLAGMELMKKGSRLSVQPVTAAAFTFICALAGLPDAATSAGEAEAQSVSKALCSRAQL
ncbi:EVE domain-containing protein [Desulfovibrio sp. ZJ369]|uniref:EVE domain-containing protein n=1 Tax=Desulfovibrio sp. ZJ369 TaxID=2709793 RepID=UPI0013E9DECD|nr:EVE domain-containing protein [Desulfovibrio sp. ZJ369]